MSIAILISLHSQELKELQNQEHSKLLNDLETERVKLQEERARMEIAKTLQSSTRPDSGLGRAEIDAAVKYAEVNKISPIFLLFLSRSVGILRDEKWQSRGRR